MQRKASKSQEKARSTAELGAAKSAQQAPTFDLRHFKIAKGCG